MAAIENKTIFNELIGKHPEWHVEKTIDSVEFAEWLSQNMSICFKCCFFYVIAVFLGKKYMEDKPKFNLRQPMMVWSLLLAVFSIIGAIRSSLFFYALYQSGGMKAVICSDLFYLAPIARFWGPVFVSSKILEYMDTLFIILRKQKLIFLHWYHHMTVSLFSWWTYGYMYAGGGVFMTVNFIVHAMMYSYYALRAANVRLPKVVAVAITSSQIVQMVIGCYTVYSIYIWSDDGMCKSSFDHLFYSGLMYLSYFILFCQFFYGTYLHQRPSEKSKSGLKVGKTDEEKSEKDKIESQNVGDELRKRKVKKVLESQS